MSLTVSGEQTSTINRPVRIIFNSLPPWQYVDEISGKPQGIAVELTETVFNSLDRTVEFEAQPWARAWQSILNGGVDAILSVSKNDYRLKHLDYLNESLWSSEYVFFTHVKNKHKYKQGTFDVTVSPQIKIGIVNGFSYNPEFWKRLPYTNGHTTYTPLNREYHKSLYAVPKQEMLFKMLARERIDLVICDKVVGKYLLKMLEIDEMVIPFEHVLFRKNYPLAFNKNSSYIESNELIIEIDEELKRMKKNGDYQKIVEDWLNAL
jgi:polar amino acid transport system substrate-binding protein